MSNEYLKADIAKSANPKLIYMGKKVGANLVGKYFQICPRLQSGLIHKKRTMLSANSLYPVKNSAIQRTYTLHKSPDDKLFELSSSHSPGFTFQWYLRATKAAWL